MIIVEKSSEIIKNKSIDTDLIIASHPNPFNTVVWNAIYENATDIHFNDVENGISRLFI